MTQSSREATRGGTGLSHADGTVSLDPTQTYTHTHTHHCFLGAYVYLEVCMHSTAWSEEGRIGAGCQSLPMPGNGPDLPLALP